jgi:hypothetical protein
VRVKNIKIKDRKEYTYLTQRPIFLLKTLDTSPLCHEKGFRRKTL